MKSADIVKLIPQQPQRQDATADQLDDLYVIANHLGMYDAADALKYPKELIRKEREDEVDV